MGEQITHYNRKASDVFGIKRVVFFVDGEGTRYLCVRRHYPNMLRRTKYIYYTV